MMESLAVFGFHAYLRFLAYRFCFVSNNIFTALHGMQTRSSDENFFHLSVRLSVCPSNAWIVTKRKKNQSRFLYHTKDHLSSREEERLVGATSSTLNVGSTGPNWSEIADFEPIIDRSA